MKMNSFSRTLLVILAAAGGLVASASAASAATVRLFGLTDNNALLSFDVNDLTKTRQINVSGLDGKLLGVDFRAANNLLYGVTDTNALYMIDVNTGVATFQNQLSPLSFEGGQLSGVDFNPAADRLRLVGSNDQNFRINVDTGAIADFDTVTPNVQPDKPLAYAAGDVNANADPNVTGAAYTNAFVGAPAGRTTQLYDIDYVLDTLVLQNPPNDGTLNTIGALGVDFQETGGFDIFSPSADENTAYATSGGLLYTIDLATGQATAQGAIGSGDTRLVGLAATSVPEPTSTIGTLLCLGLAVVGYRRSAHGSLVANRAIDDAIDDAIDEL